MANLGSVGTGIATYKYMPIIPTYQPISAVLASTSSDAGAGAQAIYRWTGSAWEKIKVSRWNGTSWVLI